MKSLATWVWQQQDWPDFQWDASPLEQAETIFLVGGGMLLGATAHLENEERQGEAAEAALGIGPIQLFDNSAYFANHKAAQIT